MVNSKQLTNKSKSAPKISLRSRSVMQNTHTTSVQSDDNNDRGGSRINFRVLQNFTKKN